ncbi:MAG: hypothetical protein RMJ98_12580 [Myxococcales bacterium]|nr:hypothetical protein [Polyangiaceae bacterium]MDW8250122.1 hypothetical protein [Myxococcales bacterium]
MARWLWLVGLALVAACTYYDSSLLAPMNPGEPVGEGGEGGKGEGGASGDTGGFSGGEGGGSPGGEGGGGEVSGAAGASGGTGGVPYGTQTQIVNCAAKPIGPPKDKPVKTEGVSFVLAIREVDFGETKISGEFPYKGYGFDLDGACSCPDDFTCKGLDSDTSRYCDGPAGRDNAGGALVASFSTLVPDCGSQSFNKAFSNGKSTLLIQIDKYNGEPDDDQVEVSWLLGENLDNIGKPLWNGEDTWPVQTASYVEDGAPPLRPKSTDKNAYVRGFVLVATLPNGSLESQGFSVNLTAPIMTATLIPPRENQPFWQVEDATMAARWRVQDLLGQLRRVNDPLSQKPLCTNNPFYPNIKAEICKFADISSGVQAQPNIPCDAISVALKFKATQCKLGKLIEVTPSDGLCSPETDPGKDSCGP